MLRLLIRSSDLTAPWHEQDGEWRAGDSFIEPVRHPMVEATSVIGARGLDLLIREGLPGGDEIAVTISDGVLRLRSGRRGTVPVSLTVVDGVLHGSWDLADLYRFASPDRLLDRAVTRLLTRQHRYSMDTVFLGIKKLTERAEATFDRGELEVRYPADAVHVLAARKLRTDADPVKHLNRLLARQVEPVVQARLTGVELSGGLDSANVALAAAECTSRLLHAFGLIGQGPSATSQKSRRAAIVSELGLADTELVMAGHLPFNQDDAVTSARWHHADGDVYREAFDELRARAAALGRQVMLTGFGGDELMSLRGAERPSVRRIITRPSWLGERSIDALPALDDNIAPAAAVAVPCLMAFAARHPSYLRHGLWPVAPLADAGLLRFAESLPAEWRAGKRLLRERLKRAGFRRGVTHPEVVETFRDTMDVALRRHGLAMARDMLDGSVLVEMGFVDERRLVEVVRCGERGGAVPELLYDTLAVERGLRSVLRAGVRSAGGSQ